MDQDRPARHDTIDRRDFLNGVAVGVGALASMSPLEALASPETLWPQDRAGYAPPVLQGMRGSHPGSFENAHALRDGDLQQSPPTDTKETYDLVIVGGGISGLAAAWFWRKAQPDARILILDNHDDIGGHAKRNEFHLGNKLHLMNGGTLEIDSPFPYSSVADGLLKELGIAPVELAKACDRPQLYTDAGLGSGVFFDTETFGVDRLVNAAPDSYLGTKGSWHDFAKRTPLSASAQTDLLRIEQGDTDYLPGLSDALKKDRLSRMSYHDYLEKVARVDPALLLYYQSHTKGEWGVGIDAVSALDCWGFGLPGFAGLKLIDRSAPRMSYTPSGYVTGGSYRFHFPDGNASIVRLLVRGLIPGAVPGHDCRDVVGAQLNYARLDQDTNAVRIRLSSIVTHVANIGGSSGDQSAPSRGVSATYVRGGKFYNVRARRCILACWNMMIPYLCPELPEAQKAALHQLVKTPLVYTSVALRNWRSFAKAGVFSIQAPGSYFTRVSLNEPVDIGSVSAERSPEKPILLNMVRTPCSPGLSEHDQNRAGRAELLATPFSRFEHEIRHQLERMMGPYGFDSARDITAITVNRWPHGYAPEWNALWQGDTPIAQQPHRLGRVRCGNISIANSDSGAKAYTDCAIDQAWRAVNEQLA